MVEPRVWWTNENRIDSCDCLHDEPTAAVYRPFQVIEYSAYAALADELKKHKQYDLTAAVAEGHRANLSELVKGWEFVTKWMNVENVRKENERHPIVVFDYFIQKAKQALEKS